MTKESILGRLLLEGNITLAELIILAESPGKTFYIDLSVLPEEDQSYFLNKNWSDSSEGLITRDIYSFYKEYKDINNNTQASSKL